MPDIGIVDAPACTRSESSARPPARPASPRTFARPARGSPTTASTAAALRRPAGDVQARLEQRALELLPCLDILDRLLSGPRAARRRPSPRPASAPIGVGRVESPRGRDLVHRRARRRPRRPRPPPHRLVRELAGRRPRGRDEPPARLPAHQQELRALLRLRGPLMLTLLRDLRKLRRAIGLPAAERPGSLALRHVDCGSCNGCEHELTLRLGPDRRHGPVRSRHRRLAPACRRPARHRARDDADARGAPDRVRGDARAAPGRRARRLRARLRRPRDARRRSSAASRTCFPSTSAFPAAHRRRTRSQPR